MDRAPHTGCTTRYPNSVLLVGTSPTFSFARAEKLSRQESSQIYANTSTAAKRVTNKQCHGRAVTNAPNHIRIHQAVLQQAFSHTHGLAAVSHRRGRCMAEDAALLIDLLLGNHVAQAGAGEGLNECHNAGRV
jgi:hypothetical protein